MMAKGEQSVYYVFGDITYEIYRGEIIVCGVNKNFSGNLIIPTSIEGHEVKRLSSYAFSGCKDLVSITIPSSVTYIGRELFRGCNSLTSINVEIGNTEYDSREGCNAIIETGTNTLIGGCKNTIIPNSVTSIGYGAFNGCSGLTSVTIPNSVTSIGNYAFNGCSGLTSITIPNSVTSIGSSAFSGCLVQNKNFINDSNLDLTKYGLLVYDDVIDNLFIKDNKVIGYKGEPTSVTIPNSVTSIGDRAFYGCSSLTSVTIPNSVTSIGDYAFDGCSGLTSVTIPNSVTSIGDRAFYGCSELTSVNISDIASWCKVDFSDWYSNPLNYAHKLFLNGEEVKDIVIPSTVKEIKEYAFSGCSGLTSVTIPNSVTSIGDRAFSVCSGLTSVTIPNSVTSIGEFAFNGCSSLTSVTIPNSVTSIGSGAFYGCI